MHNAQLHMHIYKTEILALFICLIENRNQIDDLIVEQILSEFANFVSFQINDKIICLFYRNLVYALTKTENWADV